MTQEDSLRLKSAWVDAAGRLSIPPRFSWTGGVGSGSLKSTLNLKCGAVVMITLNLSPEMEAGLLAQAQAAGLPLDEFLARQLEVLTGATTPSPARGPAGAEQWERELDAWLDSFPQHPVLSDEALKRENWYPDRW